MARRQPTPSAHGTEAVANRLHRLSVRVAPEAARRCRAGLCFDAVPRIVEVSDDQLAAIEADRMLIVERL